MVLITCISIIRTIDGGRASCASRVTKCLTIPLVAFSEDNKIPLARIQGDQQQEIGVFHTLMDAS